MFVKVILTVTEGKLKGEQFSFDSRDTCIVGRHPDCKIQIPNDKYHSTISRYHCLLDINPPAIRVRDFGSRHGTYVNGKCIGKRGKDQTASQGTKLELSQYDLSNGDVIKLSNTAFQVNIEFVMLLIVSGVYSLAKPKSISTGDKSAFLSKMLAGLISRCKNPC